MSMSEKAPSAIDKLIRVSPTQVANFVLKSTVVRAVAGSIHDSTLLLPERGVMPIYWAADGYPGIESPIPADEKIHLPIGSFDFNAPDGTVRKGTLSNLQKRAIVGRYDEQLHNAKQLLVIDEVQHGGTITELVDIVDRQVPNRRSRIIAVAAQDDRESVLKSEKKLSYTKMATGKKSGVTTNVIPMPLIGTDCDPLLNQLWYSGSTRVPVEDNPTIEIRRNREAEQILRVLGMAARKREALEDTSLIDEKVFNLAMGDKAAQRVDRWRETFIGKLKTNLPR